MEAINYVTSWSTQLMALIGVGGTFSGIYFGIKMATATDEYEFKKAKDNVKRTITGVVIGLSVSGLITFMRGIIGG